MRDVVGAEDVCVFCGVSAVAADEPGLAGPVAFVGVVTGGAALAGVGRIDSDDRHTCAGCFVGEELPELGEGPAGVCGALGLAEPYPFTDAGRLFDGDPASGAFSLGHDPLGNLVVHIRGEPSLTPDALAQQTFRRLGVLGLQFLAQFAVAGAAIFHMTAARGTVGGPSTVGAHQLRPPTPGRW